MLQYDLDYEEGEIKDKKEVIFSMKASSIESVKHWVQLLYEPLSEPGAIEHFFPIPHISRVFKKKRPHFTSLLSSVSIRFLY